MPAVGTLWNKKVVSHTFLRLSWRLAVSPSALLYMSYQDSTQRLWSAQLLALKGDGSNCVVVGLLHMKMSALYL